MKTALLCATMLAAAAPAYAAIPKPPAPTLLVTGAIDESKTTAFTGDVSAALARSTDKGVVDPSTALPHIRLVLKRPAALQTALDELTRNQHVRGSAEFRQWLTPADLRAYGPAQADIEKVVAWLKSHGLTVNEISPAGMWIDFGGTAGKVSEAFHTSLHNVTLGAEPHMANVVAPSVPAALSPVITGVTLHNFFPKPMLHKAIPGYTANTPDGTFLAVGAQDFATIYNITPLRTSNNPYGRPITGAGVTLAVVEQTMMKPADWKKFRSVFGLSGYSGTLTQTHPHGCTSPGFTGDETEAAIDAEWSSAVAPDAAIIEASCAGTAPYEFGVLTTLTEMVEKGTTATIFSISYGGDEAGNGYAFEQTWADEVQAGAAEGISIFVSTGDSGVSTSEGGITGQGLFINGLSDTAYNTAVGGTDFYDTAQGENSTYWKAGNSPGGLSAKSYIPEIPWDNGCTNSIIWNYNGGTSPIEFCNSGFTGPLQNGVGGSGGQSVYFPKPDWQLTTTPGMPNDGVRDQPDVSLFAANGIWNHFYLECMSDANEGGAPCDYKNTNDLLAHAYGGTSFAAPDFAGIAALIQESFGPGAKLGNLAPELYTLGQAQYTTPLGLSQCNATLGNKVSAACVFYDVTAGDNSEPCVAGTASCASSKLSTMGIGVLKATIGSKSIIAFPGQPGYSLATGLGSVNVTNLLTAYY
jgi:subtilase family serine protease